MSNNENLVNSSCTLQFLYYNKKFPLNNGYLRKIYFTLVKLIMCNLSALAIITNNFFPLIMLFQKNYP